MVEKPKKIEKPKKPSVGSLGKVHPPSLVQNEDGSWGVPEKK